MQRPKGRFERVIFKAILWVGIVVLIILAVFLSGSTWEMYQKERGAKGELDAAIMAKGDLEGRENKLSSAIESLKTERGREAEFRERFPVAKEGEEVFVLIDAKDAPPDTSAVERHGLWSNIQGWLGF